MNTILLLEKVGVDQNIPPLYIVAVMVTESAALKKDTDHELEYNNHRLKIEQHGVEPWGDQYEVLYDLTGFYS